MNKFIIGFLVLVAGLAVGWFVRGTVAVPEALPTPTPTPTIAVEEVPIPTAKASVQYVQGGFAPKTITITVGTAVVFTNASNGGMWVASAVHPTHQLLPGFDQKQSVQAGGTYEYTFTQVGSWQYHNHVNPQDTGTVIVTE